MAEKLFFSQDIINAWCDDAKVTFENNILTIRTDRPRPYQLEPAYRFLRVSGDDPDPHGLVGQIKTAEELATLGADVYLNSCIYGDVPYDLEQGYVAELAEKDESLEELLTQYLLKVML
ncbi:MAG: hypothetical protein A2V67_15360 [Deltaproteobacteria bacterium RBG_13_61_14]|nr:MAG: hypothetical protein A2V67_15360 [Deltaproteobacteria bacterium RBG_13_61_14]